MTEDELVPPAARLVRDFVNTREPQVDKESLTTSEQLREWLAARELLPASERLDPADLTTALVVREGLRNVLLTHAGHGSDPAAIAALNAALAEVPLQLYFTDGGHRLVAAAGPATQALAQLLDAVRACAEERTWTRLKVCARDTCRWAFYDASRNQTRRWCSMAGCGNHIKMKRAYATRRSREQQTPGASPTDAPPRP